MASPQDSKPTGEQNPGIIGNIMQTVTGTFGGAKDAVMGKSPEAKDTTIGKMGEYKDYAAEKTKKTADATTQKAIETKDFTVDKAIEGKDCTVEKAVEAKDFTVKKAMGAKDFTEKAVGAKDFTVEKAVGAKDFTVKKATEGKDAVIEECQKELSEARALVEEAERSLVGDTDTMMTETEREAMLKNKERFESVKAPSIYAIVGTIASLQISITQASGTSQLILPSAITLISCALFGVTFRYAVRRDLDNFQLKTGTSAAFGFVKGTSERYSINKFTLHIMIKSYHIHVFVSIFTIQVLLREQADHLWSWKSIVYCRMLSLVQFMYQKIF
ncbi:hypothetical protein LXL04_014865 [Taraxacum kok-saghyz]